MTKQTKTVDLAKYKVTHLCKWDGMRYCFAENIGIDKAREMLARYSDGSNAELFKHDVRIELFEEVTA